MSPKNSRGVCPGCAGTLTFNEGNIRGHMSWVCINPVSVVKATFVAVHLGCAFTQTLLWRQHSWPYIMGLHSPRLCCKGNIRGHTPIMGVHSPRFCCEGNIRGHMSWVCIYPYFHESNSLFLAMCSQTWHHECVTVSVWCLCKHFHVGLQQREKLKERRKKKGGVGWGKKWIQMSLGIQPFPPPPPPPIFLSFAVALSVTHSCTQMCACTLTFKFGGAVTTHTSIQNTYCWQPTRRPQRLQGHPPSRNLPFDFNPATLPLTFSTLLQVHWSFISLCWGGGGGGGSSYIFLSSLLSLIPCNSANKISLCSAIAHLELCGSRQWVVLL